MMPVRPEIAVYRLADGVLVHLAPAELAPTDAALGTVPLPAGFDEAIFAWDSETRAFVPDMPARRRLRWDQLKAARDAAEWAGCDTALGRVGSDPDSQRKTAGAVQMAMLAQASGQPFAITWTMADNSEVEHDAAAMIAMGVALGRHVAACHAIGAGLRARLAAATTTHELEAVAWPA